MSEALYIPVICGTARHDRKSERAAMLLCNTLKEAGVETEIIDPREELWGAETIAAWVDDDRAMRWREVAQKADGYVIVSPEYNHGYPGELKILLDAAYEEYTDKPVALCGVSGGSIGGARAVEQLKPVLIEMMMKPLQANILVSNIKKKVDEHGRTEDEELMKITKKVCNDLIEDAQTYQHRHNR